MKSLYKLLTAACILIPVCLTQPGCNSRNAEPTPKNTEAPAPKAAEPQPPKAKRLQTAAAFDADRAWQDLASQVNIGPRYVGSTGSAQTRTWLSESLEKIGYKVYEQKFSADTPEGKKEFVNIIACLEKDIKRFPASPAQDSGGQYCEKPRKPAETVPRSAIVLGAHYDTKRFPDFSFVGANDGASGTAALLELARVFKEKGLTRHRLIFCFFDGEEAIKDWSYEDSLYGSNYFTESLSSKRCPLDIHAGDIVAAVILDMIADKDLHITYETVSHPQLIEMFFTKARELGFTDAFHRDDLGEVTDDHVPFLMKNIPAIDIIGFRNTERGIYPPYWHTNHDTIDKVSADSLHVVGSAVELFVRDLDDILD